MSPHDAEPAATTVDDAAAKAALRGHQFTLLTGAWALANAADTILMVILAVWVKDLTGSDGAGGLVFACLGVPALISPLLGQVADRVSRRAMVIVSFLVGAVAVSALCAVHDVGQVALIYAVTVIYAMVGFAVAAAQSGLLRDMLPDAALGAANGRLTTIYQVFRLVMPLIGAGIYTVSGPRPLIASAMVAFLGAAVIAWRLRVAEVGSVPGGAARRAPLDADVPLIGEEMPLAEVLPAPTVGEAMSTGPSVSAATGGTPSGEASAAPAHAKDSRGSFAAEFSAGFRHIAHTPPLGGLLVATVIAFGAAGMLNAVFFAVLTRGLGLPAQMAGPVDSVQGGAAIVAGLTAARLIRRWGAPRLVTVGLLLSAVGIAPTAGSSLIAVLAGMAFLGVGVTWIVVGFATQRQIQTPPKLQGRTAAAMNTAINVPQFLVTIVAAALVSTVDYRIMVGLTVAAILVGARVAARASR